MRSEKNRVQWKKIVSRNCHLLTWSLHCEGITKGIKYGPLRAKYGRVMYIKNANSPLSTIYHDVDSFDSNIMTLISSKDHALDTALDDMERYIEDSLNIQVGSSYEELLDIYEQYKQNMAIMVNAHWMSLSMHEHIRDSRADYEVIKDTINQPYKLTFISRENKLLYEIHRSSDQNKKKDLAHKAAEKFGFAHMEYLGLEWDHEDYLRESVYASHNNTNSKVENVAMNNNVVNAYDAWLELILRRLIYLYDEAKTSLVRANWAMRKTLKYLGEDEKIIMNMLEGEFYDWLHNRRPISNVTASKRMNEYVFMHKDGEQIFVNERDEIHELLSREQVMLDEEVSKTIRQIEGTCASKGMAKGKIKVLYTYKDAMQVDPGDIIVASMTTPELIGGMRKASAFITDEGGLTCHAAIIARELNKPCIIGTSHATQVLRDGMMVEVDADRGVVTII